MINRILAILTLSLLLGSCKTRVPEAKPSDEFTIQGVDVSHHNGTIDWKTIAEKDKMTFVFIKATEGATVVDGMFSTNRSAAKTAGLMVGAYHFLTTSSDAESQFNNFKKVVKKEDIDLIPVLDAEIMTKGHTMSEADYVRHVEKWVNLCKDYYGKAPILYCSRDHFRRYFKAHFKDCMFWCGDVDASRKYVDGESWIIWQKTIKKIHGSNSKLDVNVLAPNKSLQEIAIRNIDLPDGIDVSHHQGSINWEKVPKVQFVYIKATEGATYQDPHYRRNLEGARTVGLPVGSFHYFRTSSSAHDQFINFKKNVPKEKQDLIPLVDIEECKKWSKKQFQDSLRVFLNLVERYYGKKPMIYSVQNFYRDYGAPVFNDYPLMLGRYKSQKPPTFKGKGHYTIWQYDEHGRIDGISMDVDFDRFHPNRTINDIRL